MKRLIAFLLALAFTSAASAQCVQNGQACGAYTDAQATTAANAAIAQQLSGPIAMVAGTTIGGNGVFTTPGKTSGAPATGLAYLNRYPNVTLTVPGVAVGGTGTATASVPGTIAGDQCFVAPTAATSALSYIMASGWVTTSGTVKVALAAPSVLAISATTVTVNMLCAQ